MWAGWTQIQKKQPKKRWEKDGGACLSQDVFCCFSGRRSTATCCETFNTSFFVIYSQADAIYNMVGYPDFIMNATNLDKVFNDVGKCESESSSNHCVMSHVSFALTESLIWLLSLLVRGGVTTLLPECHAVLQLLGQSDCGPTEENTLQKPVSCSHTPTTLLAGGGGGGGGCKLWQNTFHYPDPAEYCHPQMFPGNNLSPLNWSWSPVWVLLVLVSVCVCVCERQGLRQCLQAGQTDL